VSNRRTKKKQQKDKKYKWKKTRAKENEERKKGRIFLREISIQVMTTHCILIA
jgi:hypothetical protein